MRLSTQPMSACWAAAAWMEPFIGRQVQGCWRKVTNGYRLPAKYVIHAVGPVWYGGSQGEAELLASCYQRSLEIADSLAVETIAFPAIRTGIYGFPFQQAAEIAVRTVRKFVTQPTSLQGVIFCCFSEQDYLVYQA